MNPVIAGLALVFGEALLIGAEMLAAKYFDPADPWALTLLALSVSITGAALLVYGYTFGYREFKNIWVVTGLSLAGMLVVEPAVAWFLFREVPTAGASIALILGMAGIVASIVFK